MKVHCESRRQDVLIDDCALCVCVFKSSIDYPFSLTEADIYNVSDTNLPHILCNYTSVQPMQLPEMMKFCQVKISLLNDILQLLPLSLQMAVTRLTQT